MDLSQNMETEGHGQLVVIKLEGDRASAVRVLQALEIPACGTEAAESSFESAVCRTKGDRSEYIVQNYVFIPILSPENKSCCVFVTLE